MWIDHLAVSGGTRDEAAAHVTAALGVPLEDGGAHPHYGTHNHLLGLEDGLYLEAIAVDPAAPVPGHPRWFGLDHPPRMPRLSHWICRVADLEASVAALPMSGEITALARGDLRWRMAQPPQGQTAFDGVFPALIQWDGPDPSNRLIQRGVALTRLDLRRPEAERLAALLGPYLDDPRVRFTAGPSGLSAEMLTPAGNRVLT